VTRARLAGLVALLAALVAYGAIAPELPDAPTSVDIAVHTLLVFPMAAAAILVALPLAREPIRTLAVLLLVCAASALLFTLTETDALATPAKLATYALAGFVFVSLFEELWWIVLVALLVPWVDIWSVAAGPTQYVVEEKPAVFERLAVGFPNLGGAGSVNLGPPDVLFFALFLAAADRYRLRVFWTWAAMTAFLSATLVLVWLWDGVSGLPALPAVCLGFLLPNADLLWKDVARVRARSA
jgi:hypothetical protein